MTPVCAFSPVCLDCGSERCCSRSFISCAQISASLFLGSRLFTLEREREGQCQNSSARTISLRLKSFDSIQSPNICQAIENTVFLSLSFIKSLWNSVPDEWRIVKIEPNFCRHIWPVRADRLPRVYSFEISARFTTLWSLSVTNFVMLTCRHGVSNICDKIKLSGGGFCVERGEINNK